MELYDMKLIDLRASKVILLLIIFAVNAFIFYKYINAASWVLFDSPREVLTGAGYGWPMSVVVVSYLFLAVCFCLLLASAGVLFLWKKSRGIIFACAFVLGCVEVLDSVYLHFEYGTDIYDPSQYVYGPMLFIWAFLSWRMVKAVQGNKVLAPIMGSGSLPGC